MKKDVDLDLDAIDSTGNGSPSYAETLKNISNSFGRLIPTMPSIEPAEIDFSEITKRREREDKLRELQIRELETKSNNAYPLPEYNYNNNVLTFHGKDIHFLPDNDQSLLCKVLFKDIDSMRKVWSPDEIAEEWGYHEDEEFDSRKVYRAGREINKKVATETTIKDLLDVATKQVSVNLKYLK